MQSTSLGRRTLTAVPGPSGASSGARRTQIRSDAMIPGPSERRERLLRRVGDCEERVELGQLEKGAEVVVEAGDAQFPALFPRLPGHGDECAEPGGIDVAGAGEVDHEPALAVRQPSGHQLL